MKGKKKPPKVMLTIVFTIIVFSILLITMLIIGAVIFVLNKTGAQNLFGSANLYLPIIGFAITSIVTGTIVATIFSSIPLKPINTIIRGMNQLANGEYHTRIHLGHLSIAEDISSSFNTLASELEHTEMFHSDFINNFSHEFKTPIVSICGFAKLLQKNAVTKEQQQEYLSIIVDESTRLSDMATNVLNLTKVENQNIITDITCFNLSEQIRNCILMLENRWMKKELTINADFTEHTIHASEELLKQVWINLIDNAIKFSPKKDEINISMIEDDCSIKVEVKNHGPKLAEDELKRVFDKFWKGDTSHSSEGTGIGLSIARRIVQLHHGNISVSSQGEEFSFLVELPKE